jgi:restriction endonuclease S subunit
MADPIARACIVPRLPFRAVTVVDVSILRVDDAVADSRFITQLCNSHLVRDQVEKAARGTTRSRITRTELGEIKIPLPNLAEQQRIAGQLEQVDILNASLLRALQVIVPPLPLQQKFAALVERHEHLRATQREALRQAEHLFQTLLHQAFSAGV